MESPRFVPSPDRPDLNLVTVPEHASSFGVVEILGFLFRVDFWPDKTWDEVKADEHPDVARAHSNDGWFAIHLIE